MITGRGRYVDDIVLPGMLHMAIVRSTEAHAKIVSIDTAAREGGAPACTASSPAEDLNLEAPMPMAWVPPGVEVKSPETLAARQGRRSSTSASPSPIVLGADKYGVVDAAEQVVVEYDPLPVVVDPEKALEAGSPLVHEDFGTNQTHEWTIGGGDMDAAWAEADVIVERRIVNHRTAGAPIEPRVCDRRLPRRQPHASPDEPEPAPDPPLHGRRARDVRGPHPRDRAGRGRRLRRQDHALRRGGPRRLGVAQAQPPGQVDGDALGAHERRRSTAATRSTT